jgi:GNAT superfamily N-acetyltransferase
VFWLDERGPVAGVVLTEWARAWACDLLLVPGVSPPPAELLARALEAVEALELDVVEMLVRDDDAQLRELLVRAGFVPGDRSGETWMDVRERPAVAALPQEFALVDRGRAAPGPHPMRERNGDAVEARLRQCSLYDPALDLAVETAPGEAAGYALFWLDPVTAVGLVEPMRVEDAFQRRGLARVLLTTGLERLAGRGARRLKVGYATGPARALYLGSGFRQGPTSTSYTWRRAQSPGRR